MSTENVKKFFDEVEKNPALQKRIGKSMADILTTAKKHGYDFTGEDMHKHLKRRWGVTKAPKFTKTDECTIA